MSRNDILERVRWAIHIADSIHTDDTALAGQLLHAAERCREANREFHGLLENLRPITAAGETARTHLLQQLDDMDCGDSLLRSMLDPDNAHHSEIHTRTPPDQLH